MTLLESIRQRITEALAARDNHQADLDAVIAGAEAEARDLNDTENATFQELRASIVAVDTQVAELRTRETELVDVESRRQAAAVLSAEIPGGTPAVVRNEARTYTQIAERREGRSFLRDLINARLNGDPESQQRLARHMQENRVDREGMERRDVGTGAFAGLTVPQYLTDLVAPLARAGRPFADVARHHDLPADGMTVNISRITTGTAVAAQASENAAVQETNIDDTLLTVAVNTIAGQQDVSRQAIDRSVGADTVVLEDLMRAYHAELDRQLIHADGTSGTHLGLINVSGNVTVAYTDASPTAAELYPKLADIIQQIQTGVYAGVSHFLMHPRRWWWIAKELGSTFPLLSIPSSNPQQAGSLGGTQYGEMGRSIFGVPVILDGNISTALGGGTEDAIFAVTASECHLWEDPSAPLFIRAEDVGSGSLTVKLVVYGYSAFTAGRYPLANGDISGTGLAAPTF